MIIEHEFLEQVAESSFDWFLPRSLDFIAQYKNPWPVLRALYQDDCVTFHHKSGDLLPTWKVEEVFRNHDESLAENIVVKVTKKGIERANY